MKLSDKLSIPPEVMARTVGDETVILDLASGAYFGLDPVGARIWTLMVEGKSLTEILDLMLDEYDVPQDQLEGDLVRLGQELAGQGLIQVT